MNHLNTFRPAILAIWLATGSLLYAAPAQGGSPSAGLTEAPPPARASEVAQNRPTPPPTSPDTPNPPNQENGANGTSGTNNPPAPSQHDEAAQQLKVQEKQRILGVVPNFNTSYVSDAAPLSPGQKFNLAFRSAVDPFIFVAAGADAALSQAENDFPGYGQGAQGYAKRFGASYVDDFDGTMIGNAIFPVLLKQDPRYFRLGSGTFTHRLLYSISTTVWTKNDNGKWGPNYSNVLGNIAAGGISNLYYPSTDRGVGLTFERAFTVTAEGTVGAAFDEFWPDIARKVFKGRVAKLQGNIPQTEPSPPSTSTPTPAPR